MRIRVARAARRHPMLLDGLRDGRLHLSGIVRLLPVLTRENRDAVLARAAYCSKRQILELVAELSPRPDVPGCMRKLPHQRHALPPPLTQVQDSLAGPAVAHGPVLAGAMVRPVLGSGSALADVTPPSPSTGVVPSPAQGTPPLVEAKRKEVPWGNCVRTQSRLRQSIGPGNCARTLSRRLL